MVVPFEVFYIKAFPCPAEFEAIRDTLSLRLKKVFLLEYDITVTVNEM